jgi:plasmid replication initiation protein
MKVKNGWRGYKMSTDEEFEITIKRDYKVSKHNRLIQKSRYEMSLAEQRAVAYICSLIKPAEPSPEERKKAYQLNYEFDILEYAKLCGLKSVGGMLYKETRTVLKRLILKIIELELPNGNEVMLAWLVTVVIDKQSGKVNIRLNEDLAPLLFDLQRDFTAYELLNILAMKSQYSIRVYELMQSHAYQKLVTYELDKLKKMLMVDEMKGYKNFNDFRKRILEPAIAEINEYANLNVTYEPITKGRKVVKIKFLISKKEPLDRFIAQTKTTKELDHKP